MIRCTGDLEEAAATIRADYVIATSPDDPIEILRAFKGCRFHRAGTVTGTVGNLVCFADAFIGDRRDPRRGRTISPDAFGGPVTIEVLDEAGGVATRFGLATAAQVANHSNNAETVHAE